MYKLLDEVFVRNGSTQHAVEVVATPLNWVLCAKHRRSFQQKDLSMTGSDSEDWIYPYGSDERYHMQHTHLFASDLDAAVEFYRHWFQGRVVWDGDTAGARNIFMKIGVGAIHFYDQPPRASGKNAVHHLGMQVVGLLELYDRMKSEGLHIPNPIREFGNGGGYFMLGAPDNVLIEVFEPGLSKYPEVRSYYGFDDEGT